MGSDSDLPVMQAAADILDFFEINYELTIVSANRTPDRLFDYAKGAEARGLRVVIAGAGGAAHLPGMVASLSSLPATNAGILAAQILGTADAELRARIADYKKELEARVMAKVEKL
jgi:5-(carboxyamino)imidazole ribonucleotide mutase